MRGRPWQIGHDWRDAPDHKALIELLGEQNGVSVSVRQEDVPHGRYLVVSFADESVATIVLDQGFGAWDPPRNVAVRYDFMADIPVQASRLASLNNSLQRRGIGKTYLLATSRGTTER